MMPTKTNFWFAIVGKPDKFPEDAFVMKYIWDHKSIFPQSAWILHDRDYDVEPEVRASFYDVSKMNGKGGFTMHGSAPADAMVYRPLVEPHIHMLFRCARKRTASSLISFFSVHGVPQLNYAKPIDDPEAYLCYMLHDTPEAIKECKTPYNISELHGDRKLISKLNATNTNFVQFQQLLNVFQGLQFGTKQEYVFALADYASGLDPPESEALYEAFHKWAYVIMSICGSAPIRPSNPNFSYYDYEDDETYVRS